jgi:SP family xylose:H+ symportor-like MFS transporter
MSIAVASQWSANFLVSATFPVLFGDSLLNEFAHGGFAFVIYGSFGLLAAIIVLRYVPETKGLDNERAGAFWRRQADVTALHAKA